MTAPKPIERFGLCRQRVAAGCGGHHEHGPLFAGSPIDRWHCCPDCVITDEVASARETRP